MKKFLPLVSLAVALAALPAWGQTSFVNCAVTNFSQVAPGVFKVTTNLTVATNTLCRFVGIQTAGGVNNVDVIIQNPGLPAVPANWVSDHLLNTPILGPATVAVTTTSSTATGNLALFLVQFDAVNRTADASGSVVPAGLAATLRLETSTNLADWQTMTNASFPAATGNRFFRTSLSLP